MLLLRAVVAPARDALEDPLPGRGQADERAAGIALTCILAALRISSAEHVPGDLVIVPVFLIALVGVDHWHVYLVQHRLVTRTCAMNTRYILLLGYYYHYDFTPTSTKSVGSKLYQTQAATTPNRPRSIKQIQDHILFSHRPVL